MKIMICLFSFYSYYSVMGIPVNITFNGNSTITFRKVLVFKFEPEMSVGLENETITTVNLPLAVSLLLILH